jgi:RNA polymerase-binding transcription factor DksA
MEPSENSASDRKSRRLSGDGPSPVTVTTIPSATMPKDLRNLLVSSHHGGRNEPKDDDDHNNSSNNNTNNNRNNDATNELEDATICEEGNRLIPIRRLIEMMTQNTCCVECQRDHGKAVSLSIQHKQIGIATQIDCSCNAREDIGPTATIHKFSCSDSDTSTTTGRNNKFTSHMPNYLLTAGLHSLGLGQLDQEAIFGFLNLRPNKFSWKAHSDLKNQTGKSGACSRARDF